VRVLAVALLLAAVLVRSPTVSAYSEIYCSDGWTPYDQTSQCYVYYETTTAHWTASYYDGAFTYYGQDSFGGGPWGVGPENPYEGWVAECFNVDPGWAECDLYVLGGGGLVYVGSIRLFV
jgi:hypothetical protein